MIDIYIYILNESGSFIKLHIRVLDVFEIIAYFVIDIFNVMKILFYFIVLIKAIKMIQQIMHNGFGKGNVQGLSTNQNDAVSDYF